MNGSTTTPTAERDYERQLREMNEALLVSAVRQHELTEQAEQAAAALRESGWPRHSPLPRRSRKSASK